MTVFDLLVKTVDRNSVTPALSHRDNEMSYGELEAASVGFSGGLASLGIKKNSRVALLMPNCIPFVVSYFGVGRAGASLVPMNVLYPFDEALYILKDSEAEVLITTEPFRPLVKALRPHLPNLKHVVMAAEGDIENDELDFRRLCHNPPPQPGDVSDDDVAVILYTSGTTGRPKGAMLTHRNLLSNARSCAEVLPVSSKDCFMSALPLFHSFAAMVFLLLPVMKGAKIQLAERFLPSATLSLMEQCKVTVFGGVPSMFGLMLQAARDEKPDLSALRISVCGGAPLPPEIWLAFEEAFDTRLIEGYGLTEASPVVTVNLPDGLRKPGSVGPPVSGVEVRIVDEQACNVEPGSVGELIVRGNNVMKGYLHHHEDTALVIRDGWLYTGDLARMDEDGYLYIAGRKKELIIVGGLNVYPGEVERVLVEHPSVMETAVFGVPDISRGEAVWAAIVLRPDMQASEKDLQSFCRDKIASYKVPRGIEIRAELPKNALGKVMRHVLREDMIRSQEMKG